MIDLNGTCDIRNDRVDLSVSARKGKNLIELYYCSSVREAALPQAAQPYPIPYSTAHSPIPKGNMSLKAQCDFGWDRNIALALFGVLGDIRIEPKRGTRLADMNIAPPILESHQKNSGGNAHIAETMYRHLPIERKTISNVINALNRTANILLKVHSATASGESRSLIEAKAAQRSDEVDELLWFSTDALNPDEFLCYEGTCSAGTGSGDICAPKHYKSYDLEPAGLANSQIAAEDRVEITIRANHPAHFVALESDDPGHLTQKAFALFPSSEEKVTFSPQDLARKHNSRSGIFIPRPMEIQNETFRG